MKLRNLLITVAIISMGSFLPSDFPVNFRILSKCPIKNITFRKLFHMNGHPEVLFKFPPKLSNIILFSIFRRPKTTTPSEPRPQAIRGQSAYMAVSTRT